MNAFPDDAAAGHRETDTAPPQADPPATTAGPDRAAIAHEKPPGSATWSVLSPTTRALGLVLAIRGRSTAEILATILAWQIHTLHGKLREIEVLQLVAQPPAMRRGGMLRARSTKSPEKINREESAK